MIDVLQTLAIVSISLLAASVYAVQHAYAAEPRTLAASFLGFFEYKMTVDADELFPNEQVREDLISKRESSQFTIKKIEREIMGFRIIAADVRMHLEPSKVDSSNTRIDVDVKGENIEIHSIYLTKKYSSVDVDGIYGIYNAKTDKVTIHVPFAVAISLLFR